MSKIICSLLIGALFFNGALAQSSTDQELQFKQQIVGWGINQKVKVKIKSGEQLEGRISEINNDFFSVQLINNGQIANRQIDYPNIKKISKIGDNQSTHSLKKGFLYGAGIYAGMLAVGLLVVGIMAAASR